MSEYETGLRLIFGGGHYRICAGTIEGTPSVLISDEGNGTVGEYLGTSEISSGREIVALIFESEESLDVLIRQAIEAKKGFVATDQI